MTNHEVPNPVDQLDIDEQNELKEIEPEKKVSGALAAQRAIIASEVYWLGGLQVTHGNDDPRYSKHLEP
jgi:hypothetical protein